MLPEMHQMSEGPCNEAILLYHEQLPADELQDKIPYRTWDCWQPVMVMMSHPEEPVSSLAMLHQAVRLLPHMILHSAIPLCPGISSGRPLLKRQASACRASLLP